MKYAPPILYFMCCKMELYILMFRTGKGTVGASGDLAPLAHLALGMMGEVREEIDNLY